MTPVAAMVTVLSPVAGSVGRPLRASRARGARGRRRGARVRCGCLTFADGTPDLARVWFPAMFLLGIGSGLAWPTIHGIPVIGIPPCEFGSAVATNQTVLRVSGALGVAIAITLISGDTGAAALTPFHHLFLLMAISGISLSVVGYWIRTARRSSVLYPPLVLASIRRTQYDAGSGGQRVGRVKGKAACRRAATGNRAASSKWRATSCTDSGRPWASTPHGTDIAGWPLMLASARNGKPP